MADFSIKANDRRPVIRVRLGYKQPDGTFASVDLSNALGVDFILRSTDTTVTIPKINSAAQIEDAADGVVAYFWLLGDTDVPGAYKGEWEVHWPQSISETFPTLSYHAIDIVADLDSGA